MEHSSLLLAMMGDDVLATSNAAIVPLGSGLPTREELLVHYPAKFTWHELKTFINSGDLGLLKRDQKLQQRYNLWLAGVKEKYGSTGTILSCSWVLVGQLPTHSQLPHEFSSAVGKT
jgi:hypothetical protein